jgi:hypothetical protein
LLLLPPRDPLLRVAAQVFAANFRQVADNVGFHLALNADQHFYKCGHRGFGAQAGERLANGAAEGEVHLAARRSGEFLERAARQIAAARA